RDARETALVAIGEHRGRDDLDAARVGLHPLLRGRDQWTRFDRAPARLVQEGHAIHDLPPEPGAKVFILGGGEVAAVMESYGRGLSLGSGSSQEEAEADEAPEAGTDKQHWIGRFGCGDSRAVLLAGRYLMGTSGRCLRRQPWAGKCPLVPGIF